MTFLERIRPGIMKWSRNTYWMGGSLHGSPHQGDTPGVKWVLVVGSWTVWVQIRVLPLNSWVPGGQFLHLPDLAFPHVSNGYHNNAHLVGCCEEEMNELT